MTSASVCRVEMNSANTILIATVAAHSIAIMIAAGTSDADSAASHCPDRVEECSAKALDQTGDGYRSAGAGHPGRAGWTSNGRECRHFRQPRKGFSRHIISPRQKRPDFTVEE